MSSRTERREPLRARGKTLYRIDVTQTRDCTLWVLAETRAQAEEDAAVLELEIEDYEWDDVSTDSWVQPSTSQPPAQHDVWTGGGQGENVKATDLHFRRSSVGDSDA